MWFNFKRGRWRLLECVVSGCERDYLQQRAGGGCSSSNSSCTNSLNRSRHTGSSNLSDLGTGSLHRNSHHSHGHHSVMGQTRGHRTTATHIHHHHSSQHQPQCLNEPVMRRSTSGSSSSRHNTLQRSVRFEVAATSAAAMGETDVLLDESMPLPQPPATFSDPPSASMQPQLLRVCSDRHQDNEASTSQGGRPPPRENSVIESSAVVGNIAYLANPVQRNRELIMQMQTSSFQP